MCHNTHNKSTHSIHTNSFFLLFIRINRTITKLPNEEHTVKLRDQAPQDPHHLSERCRTCEENLFRKGCSVVWIAEDLRSQSEKEGNRHFLQERRLSKVRWWNLILRLRYWIVFFVLWESHWEDRVREAELSSVLLSNISKQGWKRFW